MNRIGGLPWRPTGRREGKRCRDSGGHAGFEHAHGFLRHLIDVGTVFAFLPAITMLGLSTMLRQGLALQSVWALSAGRPGHFNARYIYQKRRSRPGSFPE